MWIVRLALRRPYTFVVAAMLVADPRASSRSSACRPTSSPNIDIPVDLASSCSYAGMSADEMEKRIVTQFERVLTTTVNDIEHIESQSLNGVGVIKIYFQPGAKIEAATAQVTAVCADGDPHRCRRARTPPLIIRYSASSVPILQLSLSSDTLPEQQLFDIAINRAAPAARHDAGRADPLPVRRQAAADHGRPRPGASSTRYGLSPRDVSTPSTRRT